MEENNNPQQNNTLDGLTRLAFGRINDAVLLLSGGAELGADEISRLDLFQISEIRQNKEGGLDIKFYDRLKAFELLLAAYPHEEPPAASSFFGALESAAKSACDPDAI